MPVTQVQIFFQTSHSRLDGELSSWLESRQGEIRVTGLSLDSNEYGHCLAVLYQEEPGPVYAGRVWFNRKHSELQREANLALAAEGAPTGLFVAAGSNQHGHCLCMIGAYKV